MSTAKDVSSASTPPEYAPTQNWRFEFGDYAQTRCFLDEMAVLSKRLGFYPDMSFGKTYVNVTIDEVGRAVLGENMTGFITEMEAFAVTGKATANLAGER